MECCFGDKCYRRNLSHFRNFTHPHLEAILDIGTDDGEYKIPSKFNLQRNIILEQLQIIVDNKLYEPVKKDENVNTDDNSQNKDSKNITTGNTQNEEDTEQKNSQNNKSEARILFDNNSANKKEETKPVQRVVDVYKAKKREENESFSNQGSSGSSTSKTSEPRDSDYPPIVLPTCKAEDYLKVVRPKDQMAAKHAASAPYYIFYTTIEDTKETHEQPYSITFLEILDHSLGELKCSLQISFYVEMSWLFAQYYFAGYSKKRLTILYGVEHPETEPINRNLLPHVDAYRVSMATSFANHHSKIMVLCYEDGSLRVVVSTANLYSLEWENITQGLWMSPKCPELPPEAMPHEGESPTMFKRMLLQYLNHYKLPQVSYYVERIKKCDFSHINVFLVASVPGFHFDMSWGQNRIKSLLRQHCYIPPDENKHWTLIAQASSIGTYGKDPKLWLMGEFLHSMCKIKDQPQTLTAPPELKVIFPSLENVEQSQHDYICLSYVASTHAKQSWLNNFLYQWKATSTHRNKAIPHLKSYLRISPDNKMAAFYLLTSSNISKAAWGTVNRTDAALRLSNYEAGVLFLPKFVINEDYFPLSQNAKNRLIIPYDIPLTKYTNDMTPWVSDDL